MVNSCSPFKSVLLSIALSALIVMFWLSHVNFVLSNTALHKFVVIANYCLFCVFYSWKFNRGREWIEIKFWYEQRYLLIFSFSICLKYSNMASVYVITTFASNSINFVSHLMNDTIVIVFLNKQFILRFERSKMIYLFQNFSKNKNFQLTQFICFPRETIRLVFCFFYSSNN